MGYIYIYIYIHDKLSHKYAFKKTLTMAEVKKQMVSVSTLPDECLMFKFKTPLEKKINSETPLCYCVTYPI